MANYTVKLGHQEDITLWMSKQQKQSNLSDSEFEFLMLFRVHHIVQKHPDHPDHRLTINMSETLVHVPYIVFERHNRLHKFMSHFIYKLQLHKDSLGRFLSLRGDGVQLFLSGLFDNKLIPVASQDRFIRLFHIYLYTLVTSANEKVSPIIEPIVIDCEIVRCHQYIDLKEAIAWWKSTPISPHDMVPAASSSSLIYREYKLARLFGLCEEMDKLVIDDELQPKQCSICLQEFPLGMEVTSLYCLHTFHEHCITQWFKKSRTCPVCRLLLD